VIFKLKKRRKTN